MPFGLCNAPCYFLEMHECYICRLYWKDYGSIHTILIKFCSNVRTNI
jgi:hypothetical protein